MDRENEKDESLLFEKRKRNRLCVVPPVCEVAPLLRDFSVNVLCCIVFVWSFATHNTIQHNTTALNGTRLLGSLSLRCYAQLWCLFVLITNITITLHCHHFHASNLNFFHFQGPIQTPFLAVPSAFTSLTLPFSFCFKKLRLAMETLSLFFSIIWSAIILFTFNEFEIAFRVGSLTGIWFSCAWLKLKENIPKYHFFLKQAEKKKLNQ